MKFILIMQTFLNQYNLKFMKKVVKRILINQNYYFTEKINSLLNNICKINIIKQIHPELKIFPNEPV